MRKLKSDKGFSLAEVMVAAALLGVIALGSMRMLKTQSKSASTTEAKFEITSALNSIRISLANRDACWNTFGITAGTPENTGTYDPNNLAAGTITEILDENGRAKYTSNLVKNNAPRIGGSNVRILSFRLSTASPDIAAIPADSTGQTELIVRFYRGKTTFGKEEIDRKILLNVRTDASGDMVDCGSEAVDSTITDAEFACSSLGGTFDRAGRGGNGDCHSIAPNNTTVFNGNVVVNDTYTIELLSDARLKHSLEEIDSPLDRVNKLEPVTFRWNKNGKKEIGFIAQNVKSVFPDLVSQTRSGYYAVKYSQVSAINVAAIQELNTKLMSLIDEVMLLKEENIDLKNEIKKLKESK